MSAQKTVSIVAKDLKVYYRNSCALSIPELEVTGHTIAVIGHNGSGKSTLIKTLLQLLPPRSGSLQAFACGQENQPLVPEEHMAYAPENGAVFNDVSVESYLRMWCRFKQHNANYYKQDGRALLDELSISPLLPKLGRELSKGQRRRVQIAAGLLIEPRFFLFDEPFDGLDVLQSSQLTSIIQSEAKKRTMLVSTHRMDIVERICDTIIVLDNGKVSASGTVDSICQQLADRSIALDFDQTVLPQISAVAQTLGSAFPKSLITTIGPQILVTGKNIDEAQLLGVLAQNNVTPLSIVPIRCSLVDAMSYHLRSTDGSKIRSV